MNMGSERWRHRHVRGKVLSKVRGFQVELDELGFVKGEVPPEVAEVFRQAGKWDLIRINPSSHWAPVVAEAEAQIEDQKKAVKALEYQLSVAKTVLDKKERALREVLAKRDADIMEVVPKPAPAPKPGPKGKGKGAKPKEPEKPKEPKEPAPQAPALVADKGAKDMPEALAEDLAKVAANKSKPATKAELDQAITTTSKAVSK